MLRLGSKVQLIKSGQACTVEKFLGQGGQGAVFQVRSAGKPYALKWYYPHTATQHQRQLLDSLLDIECPSDRFLWPIDLASTKDQASFGYIMPIRSDDFVSMAKLMSRGDVSFRELATMGLELATSFFQLHNRGLCYRDINWGNAFFQPSTGSVLICDLDNVGINEQSISAVRGADYFMAPEIVRREAMPSTKTDRYSLAVLLFYMFCLHHPLEGKRALQGLWDAAAQEELFGRDPRFIFDPADDSNAADPIQQPAPLAMWPLFPQFFRDRFIEAFTTGLKDPDARVADGVWRRDLVRLRDSIVYCAKCRRQNFFDEAKRTTYCWSCRHAVQMPPRLVVRGNTVMLNYDTTIYPHHLYLNNDFTTPIAKVVRHPTNPGVWGLQNVRADAWTFTDQDGTVHEVGVSRSVTLRPNLRVNFGPAQGVVLVDQGPHYPVHP